MDDHSSHSQHDALSSNMPTRLMGDHRMTPLLTPPLTPRSSNEQANAVLSLLP
jgi:hypothetical protein